MKLKLSINMAMTLDGKVVRPDGKWYGLTSKNDRKQMDIYRSKTQVILIGKNSIINDDPVLHLKYYKSENSPRPVILVRKGILPPSSKIFSKTQNEKPIIICTENNFTELQNKLGILADVIKVSDPELKPRIVLETLEELGYRKVLLEGGPTLNYSFFKEGLVDRIHLTIVPYLIGQNTLPAIIDGKNPLKDFDLLQWKLVEHKKIENEIFLTYEKHVNFQSS